jgi:hypothetical protein
VIRAVRRRILLVLSAGYILMFFSEHMFWARYRPESGSLGSYLSTWMAYVLISFTIGFWILPNILSRNRRHILPAAIGIGLFFGAWAINWNTNLRE